MKENGNDQELVKIGTTKMLGHTLQECTLGQLFENCDTLSARAEYSRPPHPGLLYLWIQATMDLKYLGRGELRLF